VHERGVFQPLALAVAQRVNARVWSKSASDKVTMWRA
jgi:hypothetical protein